MTPRTRKAVNWLLTLIGFGSAVAGLSFAILELYHSVTSRHPLIWQNLAGAALFLGAGASIIATGSVRETVSILRDAWPLMSTRRPGGRRRTDPPRDPK